MNRPRSFVAFLLFAIVALLANATVAVAHGHLHAKPDHDSRCQLCIVVHAGSNAVAPAVPELHFSFQQTTLHLPEADFVKLACRALQIRDRAPPLP